MSEPWGHVEAAIDELVNESMGLQEQLAVLAPDAPQRAGLADRLAELGRKLDFLCGGAPAIVQDAAAPDRIAA